MHLLVVLLLSLLPRFTHGLDVGFTSPHWQDTTNPSPYAGDSQWPLGSTQVVAFSTPWTEYRLEFWQEDLPGGSAQRSSQFIYNQTAGKEFPQSFQWTVQTYEFQLSHSPVFFFWLFDNTNSSNQQSSAYFNITIQGASSLGTSSSPTPTQSSTLTASSSTAPSTPTFTNVSSVHTSSMPTPTHSGTTEASKGLSTGAKAGIGVGAALGGLLVLGIASILFLKRRSGGQWQQRPELQDSHPMESSPGDLRTVVPTSQSSPKLAEAPSYRNSSPVELGG
ncbi:hypothetical protein F5Y07DRAFT_145904 [Xylaria sp. FL0933]|nr:hypothetical protein F5Y07DRAFT_145904 [Xylaria sp. FL0933]